MKVYALLALLFFSSFQSQGMENESNREIQTQIKNYVSIVEELCEIIGFYMEESKVNGKDYSELVNDKIDEVCGLSYQAEIKIENLYKYHTNCINAFTTNAVNQFIKADKQNGQVLGKLIKRPFLVEKAEEQKEEEIRSLTKHCQTSLQQICDFYDEPYECLKERNDAYVNIYFSLRSLRVALMKPIDQNNPQAILAHYQNIESRFKWLQDTITGCEGTAFHAYEVTFEQEIDVMGTSYLFSYSMAGESLTRELIRDINPALINFYNIGHTINNLLS